MSNAAPAASWFPDPSDPAQLRWWDGVQWTAHVHPVAPVQQAPRLAVVPDAQAQAQAASVPAGRVQDLADGGTVSSFEQRHADRHVDGYAHASQAAETPDWTPELEARQRAELVAGGMTAEQAQVSLDMQRKLIQGVRKLEKNRFTRWIGHQMLRSHARKVSQSEHADSFDITFGGVRYQAKGEGRRMQMGGRSGMPR
ncbi:MAG: Scramblase family protein [Thermoleophilia bacterium]|nr:Scramblase family protein [Thermoleophilia bacterium]